MRGATGVILQLHQILRLPGKMNLLIDPRHIWNVIFNARSNWSHPPTSPNTAPATKNESHDWAASHMKRHLHCAEQQKSSSKPNIAPAKKNESHDWSASHMKRHLQCAEQQESSSNFTKYCTCHAKWISWLIFITYETSFTMRGATRVILLLHQIVRLPRKKTLMIDPLHIWSIVHNARSNRSHPPTSPNTAPATKFWVQDFTRKSLNCFRQYKDDSTTIRAWSEDNPTTKSSSRTRRFWDLTRPTLAAQFVLKNTTFRRSGYRLSPKISRNAAAATKSDTPTSPNIAPASKSDSHD